MKSPFQLDEKVAVVTGGANGIGKAACLRLAEAGARVAVTDVDEDKAAAVADEIDATGGEAASWILDVSEEEEVGRVMREVREKFGSIDILVNNAGISGVDKRTEEISAAEWSKVISINVNGVFFCTKHALPHLREAGGGSIINLSSIYGIISAPDLPPYHASKGAVRSMSKTDALLYAPEGIRVNSVHPAFIWTPLVADLAERSGQSVEEFRAALDGRHPIGHVGEPDDIAYGIVYLASDAAKFVTGSELVIDGGYTAQ